MKLLSPSEFTVGKVGSAKALSLVLPTSKYEETILVGQIVEAATAVFLSGAHKSQFFECEGNETWGGVIIPDVRIEVDETSLVDSARSDAPPLSVIRTDTRLLLAAKTERSFGRLTHVTLHDNLAPAGEFRAEFAKWQVVVGEGQNTRVVWSTTDVSNE